MKTWGKKKKTAKGLLSFVLLTTTFTVGFGMVATPSEARGGKEVRVEGKISKEMRESIRELRKDWGIPISARKCRANEQFCIKVERYSKDDQIIAYTSYFPGEPGNATIFINDKHDGDYWYRKMTAYHELGHALGLEQHGQCGSSMAETVPACDHYYVGYSREEHQKLLEIWE